MPTICSAIRKAMRVGERTVGTSTNCSADCGSGTRERDGHGEQEILGTSITCSATGRSKRRKKSIAQSTTCGTGASRICTNGARSAKCYTACRCTRPSVRTSSRGVGRVGGGVIRPMASYNSSLSSSLALAVFWPRGAVWCVASARAMATLIRAYRKYAQRRRSRRLLAAPVAGAWSTGVSNTEAIFL